MRISNFLCKVSLLLAVCTLMFIAYGCIPCGPPERDFHTFDMDLLMRLKDPVGVRRPGKGDKQFMVYRQREDTLIIELRAWLPGPSSSPETCTRGFVHWITSMDVVSDADWDAAHPAGTSLADIIEVFVIRLRGNISASLNKLVFDATLHTSMMWDDDNPYGPASIHIFLYLPNPPHPGKHVFTVKVGKSNGNDFEQQSIPVIWD